MIKHIEIAAAREAHREISGTYPTVLLCSEHDKRQMAIERARRRYPQDVRTVERLKRGDINISTFDLKFLGMTVRVADIPAGKFQIA